MHVYAYFTQLWTTQIQSQIYSNKLLIYNEFQSDSESDLFK